MVRACQRPSVVAVSCLKDTGKQKQEYRIHLFPWGWWKRVPSRQHVGEGSTVDQSMDDSMTCREAECQPAGRQRDLLERISWEIRGPTLALLLPIVLFLVISHIGGPQVSYPKRSQWEKAGPWTVRPSRVPAGSECCLSSDWLAVQGVTQIINPIS